MIKNIMFCLVAVITVITSGCGGEALTRDVNAYVTYRDVPERPVFTVISNSNDDSGDKLVKDVERVLISLGLDVVRPPALKTIETKTGNVDSSESKAVAAEKDKLSGLNKGIVSAGSVTEVYYALGDTDADYFFFIDSSHGVFKLVKKVNLEILAIGDTKYFSDYKETSRMKRTARYQVQNLFITLGINISVKEETISKRMRGFTFDYIAHKKVPNKPVFTVLKEHKGAGDDKLVIDAERMIIDLGVSVVRPPIEKIVAIQSGDSKAASSVGAVSSEKKSDETAKGRFNSEEVTEIYRVLDETVADYYLSVNSQQNTFKIINKESKRILAVEDSIWVSSFYDDQENRKLIYKLFSGLGFNVKREP